MDTLDIVNVLGPLLIFLFILFVLFMIIRGLILWYWRINRIVHLLEQIERNTQPSKRVVSQSFNGDEEEETELFSTENIRITNKRLIVPPHEWGIAQFQPVKVEFAGGSYRIDLLDVHGNRIHYLNSDNKERIDLIAEAINKAVGQ